MIYEKQIASNSKGKFIEVEKTTGDALEVFLFEKNIIDEIDHNIHSDPTANCDIPFTELAMQNNCKCSQKESSLTKENICRGVAKGTYM